MGVFEGGYKLAISGNNSEILQFAGHAAGPHTHNTQVISTNLEVKVAPVSDMGGPLPVPDCYVHGPDNVESGII